MLMNDGSLIFFFSTNVSLRRMMCLLMCERGDFMFHCPVASSSFYGGGGLEMNTCDVNIIARIFVQMNKNIY